MKKSGRSKAYGMQYDPVVLKELARECDISQAEFADAVSGETGQAVSRPLMNLVINRGYEPPTIAGFRAAVETALGKIPRVLQWLSARGLRLADIWQPLGRPMRGQKPCGHGRRVSENMPAGPALVPADPEIITVDWEVEMISQEALRHFKVFRNPFIDDIQKDADIYMSDEHRYIEAAMLDAARHGGFLAIIGEVGSGKSVMRRKVIEQLKRDGDTLVIFPQMIDKTRLTAASICDAIVLDVSSERPLRSLEGKTRQVQRLLMDRSKSGYRAVLIIEEAHDLNVQTLKYLKRFYELEDGYRKLLGIVLIGQSELKQKFNEGHNVDMREVIRRVQVAEIRGLNGHLSEYLGLKFKRVGKQTDEVFCTDAFEALSARLTSVSRDGKSKISHAYPLLVNNYVARAMNMAFEMGEEKISADVVMAL